LSSKRFAKTGTLIQWHLTSVTSKLLEKSTTTAMVFRSEAASDCKNRSRVQFGLNCCGAVTLQSRVGGVDETVDETGVDFDNSSLGLCRIAGPKGTGNELGSYVPALRHVLGIWAVRYCSTAQ